MGGALGSAQFSQLLTVSIVWVWTGKPIPLSYMILKRKQGVDPDCMHVSARNVTAIKGPQLNREPPAGLMTDLNKRICRCAYSYNTHGTRPSETVLESALSSRASVSCCGPTAMETTLSHSVTTLAWRRRGDIPCPRQW
jgi:hypothetical protein